MIIAKQIASSSAFLATVALLLAGCATTNPTSPGVATQPMEQHATNAECGSAGILEWEPGSGATTRQGALEDMLRGHRDIMGTPQADQLRSTPEDVIVMIEAALRALPELEEQRPDGSAIMVPAVAEDGTALGEVFIAPNGDNYIISHFVVAHESGVPCSG